MTMKMKPLAAATCAQENLTGATSSLDYELLMVLRVIVGPILSFS